MANTESKKLAIDVIARVDRLEKAMAKASKVTAQRTGQMEKRVTTMRTRVERDFKGMASKIGGIGGKLVAPILALGAAGTIRAVGDVARGMAEIADEAKRAGVNARAFQELKFVAEQNRIGVDALTDGLKELNLRADEFITTGAGSAAEAFQRIGYNADTLKAKLEDPSALFTEIIGKLGQLNTAARIRIADEIFGGTGGEKFVQLIDQGEEGLRRTIDRGHELGAVMSNELIEKADDLDRKFAAVATTVGSGLKRAIVEAANALSLVIEEFQAIDQRTHLRPLQNKLVAIENERVPLKEQIAEIEDTIARAGENNPISLALSSQLAGDKKQLEALTDQALELQDQIYKLQGMNSFEPSDKGIILPSDGIKPQSSSDSAKRTKSVVAEADAVLKLIDALKFEQATIGMTARELAVANALRDAGSAATARQRSEIEVLVGANFDLIDALESNADAMQLFEDTSSTALRGFIDDLAEGKSAADAMANVLSQLGSQLIDMGVSGLTSGLSSVIFPHANGGIAARGKPKMFANGGISKTAAIFGEAGPEAAVPLPDGRRIPVDLRMPKMSSANDNVSVSIPISIDATGADAAGLARLQGQLAQLQAELPTRIRAEVKGRGKKWM